MKYIRITMVFLFVVSLGLYGLSWVKEKQLEDSTKPSLTSDREEQELSVDYEEGDLLEGLTASDAKDGDLTDQIIVGSFSQFLEPGVCNVSYVVFDSANQPAVLTRKTRFTDYRSPQFTLSQPLVFRAGAGSNAVSQVGANDVLDGDLTSLVRLVESDVNYREEGEYSIQVEVSNSFGDTQEASLPVHIVEGSNAALEIELMEPLVYVKKGEGFDPNLYVESVEDADGNLVSGPSLTVESSVNSQEAGCYEVHYQVTNEQGLSGETWLTVIVRE